jgi:hypothetical protein
VVVVVLMVVRVFLAFVVVPSICFVMMLLLLVIAMRDKLNLAADLLKMQIAIEVILEAQDPLALLIRPKNKEGPCRPLPVIHEGEPAIFIKPDVSRTIALRIQFPMAGKLLVKGSTVVGVQSGNIRIGRPHHVQGKQKKDHQHRRKTGSIHAANIHHARGLILQFLSSLFMSKEPARREYDATIHPSSPPPV